MSAQITANDALHENEDSPARAHHNAPQEHCSAACLCCIWLHKRCAQTSACRATSHAWEAGSEPAQTMLGFSRVPSSSTWWSLSACRTHACIQRPVLTCRHRVCWHRSLQSRHTTSEGLCITLKRDSKP